MVWWEQKEWTKAEAQKERREVPLTAYMPLQKTQQYKIHITNHVVPVGVGTRVSTNMWQCTFRSHLLFFFRERSHLLKIHEILCDVDL